MVGVSGLWVYFLGVDSGKVIHNSVSHFTGLMGCVPMSRALQLLWGKKLPHAPPHFFLGQISSMVDAYMCGTCGLQCHRPDMHAPLNVPMRV